MRLHVPRDTLKSYSYLPERGRRRLDVGATVRPNTENVRVDSATFMLRCRRICRAAHRRAPASTIATSSMPPRSRASCRAITTSWQASALSVRRKVLANPRGLIRWSVVSCRGRVLRPASPWTGSHCGVDREVTAPTDRRRDHRRFRVH